MNIVNFIPSGFYRQQKNYVKLICRKLSKKNEPGKHRITVDATE